MKFEQPPVAKQELTQEEKKDSLVESLKPASDFYGEKAKKLYDELSTKYNMKKVIDWESQQYPLEATDKVREVITDESDLATYEEFTRTLNLPDEIKGVSANPDSQDALRERLNARAKTLFEKLGKKYDIKKAVDWESQQYPLEATEKVREIVTDETDLAAYEEFAQSLHAVDVLKKKDIAN